MGHDEQLWSQPNLNKVAQNRAADAIQQTGRALPCTVTEVNGALVTVQFDVIAPFTLWPLTLPKNEAPWARMPTQIGDRGMTQPADTLISTAAGISSGLPDVTVTYGNMSTLVWTPVANVNSPPTPDPNKYWTNGPNGAIVGSTDQSVQIVFDKTLQTVTITCGEQTIVLANDPSLTATVTGPFGNMTATTNGTTGQFTQIVPSTLGDLKTFLDGTTGAMSHIVPSGGGVLSLGALASALNPTTRAAAVQDDLNTLSNGPSGIVKQTLVNLCSALGAAANGTLTGGAAFEAIIAASGFIPGISNIAPLIPGCSTSVLIKP
jgi:hypothetical protein